jgi:hypothetical protein
MMMKPIAWALALTVATAMQAAAAQGTAPPATGGKAAAKNGDDAHRKDDVAKHRTIARAHEEAARCLARGEKESVCHERLRAACQGIAVGRYCGMRHTH